MPSVFINYRRTDSGASAGRLTDDLKEQLRGVRVFRDVAEMHPGEDFRVAIENLLKSIAATGAGLRFEPLPEGAVVPSAGVVDAVGRGTLDAALISPQLLYDKGKAFALMDGAPFGPEGEQYVSWRKSPVATETIELMYQRVGAVGVLCGVTGPHGDFWLRESVTKIDELRSLQVRSHGLYAALLETAGVKTVSASSTPGPMGAELSLDPWMPSTAGVWTTYAISHLGGSRSLDLVVNASRWKTLEATARAAIVAACASNVRWTLEQSRAAVNKAIHEARARKMRVYLMPRGVTALLRRAWLETRAGLSGSDGTFSRLQASMEQFEDAAARPIASAYGL